jgi:hypothetical protein
VTIENGGAEGNSVTGHAEPVSEEDFEPENGSRIFETRKFR